MRVGFLLLIIGCIGGIQAAGLLYPHTQNNGDQLGPIRDDESFRMHFRLHFRYWGVTKKTMHIYENGVLDFTGGFDDFTPATPPVNYYRLIMPYWADHNIEESGPGSHIWWRETKDAELADRATADVRAAFPCSPDFKARELIIVTWQRVASYYGANWCNSKRRQVDKRSADPKDEDPGRAEVVPKDHGCSTTSGQVSYQVVLINGGPDDENYVMFNFHSLEWSEGYLGETTQTGFNKGNGDFVMLPVKGPALATSSNVGMQGRWMYQTQNKPKAPGDINC